MTANCLDHRIAACLDAGMNAHVGKPFRRNDLITTIARQLKPALGKAQGPCFANARRACKPDSVTSGLPPRPMTIPLDAGLPLRLQLPTRIVEAKAAHARSLFGIAPGGACHAGPVARPAVGSYPTVSPLPACRKAVRVAVSSLWRFPWGCPRRALPGTVALWSPDFPRRGRPPRGHPALRAMGQIVLIPRSVNVGWVVPARAPGFPISPRRGPEI